MRLCGSKNFKNRDRIAIFPKDVDELKGISAIDKVIIIDQSPIGRTPRSNPVTYTGVFDTIREVFTQTKLSFYEVTGLLKGINGIDLGVVTIWLHESDIAILNDFVTDHLGEEGCVLEIYSAVGTFVMVVNLPVENIETLQPTDRLSVRSCVNV